VKRKWEILDRIGRKTLFEPILRWLAVVYRGVIGKDHERNMPPDGSRADEVIANARSGRGSLQLPGHGFLMFFCRFFTKKFLTSYSDSGKILCGKGLNMEGCPSEEKKWNIRTE